MSSQTALTEHLLHRGDSEHVQALLFARTSPLLVLRAMPVSVFQWHCNGKDLEEEEEEEEEEQEEEKEQEEKQTRKNTTTTTTLKFKSVRLHLCHELMSRMFQIYEYEQVRKLSAELMGRMPVEQYACRYAGIYLEYFCRRAVASSSSTAAAAPARERERQEARRRRGGEDNDEKITITTPLLLPHHLLLLLLPLLSERLIDL